MAATPSKSNPLEKAQEEVIKDLQEHVLNLERAAIQGCLAVRRDNFSWDNGNDGDVDLGETVYDDSTTALLYESKERALISTIAALELKLSSVVETCQTLEKEAGKKEEAIQEKTRALEDNSKALKFRKNQLRDLNNKLEKAQYKVKVQVQGDTDASSTANIQNAKAETVQAFYGSTIDQSIHHHYHQYSASVAVLTPVPGSQSAPQSTAIAPAAPTTLSLPVRTKQKRRTPRSFTHSDKMPQKSNICQKGDDCKAKSCKYIHPQQIKVFGDKIATLDKDTKPKMKK